MREADINHDGAIDLQEFKRLLTGQLQDNLELFESRLGSRGTGSTSSTDVW